MKHQHECLLELRQHLRCSRHSLPGRPVYCWPEPGGQASPGGHRELTHEDMTLWAKHIVSKMSQRKNKANAYHWLMRSRLAKQQNICPRRFRNTTTPPPKSQGMRMRSQRHITPSTSLLPRAQNRRDMLHWGSQSNSLTWDSPWGKRLLREVATFW